MVGILPLWGSRSPRGGDDEDNYMILELMVAKSFINDGDKRWEQRFQASAALLREQFHPQLVSRLLQVL